MDGLPLVQVAINPTWLEWNNRCVAKFVEGIQEYRTFADLPVLADALEEAGCDNANVLAHCRLRGEHTHACWVVAALLEVVQSLPDLNEQ